MTFYSLVTLSIPFGGSQDDDAMHRVNNGERPPRPATTMLSESRPIESIIWELIETMWAHLPANRPTAGDIVKRVQYAHQLSGAIQSSA
ncbi:hypothetical protein DL93DRAFT_2084952 [Clavulina sp. PMI_390]|nr:hypothetical protein DL93DRAFT_2084952 [Clavulina sp. PMI_390]